MRWSTLALLVAVLESSEAATSDFEGSWTSSEGTVVTIHVADSKAIATGGGAFAGKSFEGSIIDNAIHWLSPSDADGEIWELGPDGKVTDKEGNIWTRNVPATVPTTLPAMPLTTSPPLAGAPLATTSPLVAAESPATTSVAWWVPPSTSSHGQNKFMSWIHSIGIKEDISDDASLAAALDSSPVDASNFEGDWKSASGIVVHVHVSDSRATASSVKIGETFEGSVTGNTIHWQEPEDAAGEIWRLGEDGKTITDTEGNLWTHTITTTSPATTTVPLVTAAPAVTAAPVPPSTTRKENRFMAWLHSIGLK